MDDARDYISDRYLVSLMICSYSESLLNKFIDSAYAPKLNTDLSLNNILPCPEELSSLQNEATAIPGVLLSWPKSSILITKEKRHLFVKNYGFWNSHDWCLSNWGTPLDIRAKMTIRSDMHVNYIFECLSGPPIKWIKHVGSLYEIFGFEMNYFGFNNGVKGKFVGSFNEFNHIAFCQ